MSTNFQLKSLDRMSLVYSLINQSVNHSVKQLVDHLFLSYIHKSLLQFTNGISPVIFIVRLSSYLSIVTYLFL